jgi:hypothetical protein
LFDLSQHRYIEICYVAEGAGLHRIWNKIYSCKKGSLSILNIAVPHGWFAKDKEQSVTVSNIIFDINDILIGELAEIGNRRFLFNLFSSNNFAVNKGSNFTGLNNCIFVSCCNIKNNKYRNFKSAISIKL